MDECELRKEFDELKGKLEEHERILRGRNGDKGVLERVGMLESIAERLVTAMDALNILLRGRRESDDVGLLGDMRDLKRAMTTVNRLLWLITGGIIGLIIQSAASHFTIQ